MTCPSCAGTVELPEYSYPAYCATCDVFFQLWADYGWWGYSCEVYVMPEES